MLALCGKEPPPPASAARLEIVARGLYADREELHRGGMGRAVRARDRRLGREVVLKELLDPDAYQGDFDRATLRARLEEEAALTARLQHPSIVQVYEAGRWPDGEPFYAMAWVRGKALSAAIEEAGAAAPRLALLSHVAAACDAVAYAHARGIVHRDVKPENILIGEFGETVVIDWGLAKDLAAPGAAAAVAVTSGGMTVLGAGTVAYMSPEQASGQPPGPAFDVYALGATLYHVLSGVAPYAEAGSSPARQALLSGPPLPVGELAPGLPPELVAIVQKAMARDAQDRFATAGELAEELRRFMTGQLTRTYAHSASELLRRWVARHRAVVAAAGVGGLLAAAVAVVGVVRIAREQRRAEASERRALVELAPARAARAAELAQDPRRTLEALELGVLAVGPSAARREAPPAEASAGLMAALGAPPLARPLMHTRGRMWAYTDRGSALLVSAAGTVWPLDDEGQPQGRLETGLDRLMLAGRSPGGRYIAAFGYTPLVRLLDTAGGPSRDLPHGDQPWVALWMDGQRLVTGDHDRSVRLWAAGTGAELGRVVPPAAPATLATRPGHVVIGTIDGRVYDWRPPDPTLRELPAVGAQLTWPGWFADGRLIAGTVDGRILVWPATLDGPPTVRSIGNHQVTSSGLSADERHFAVGTRNGITLVVPTGEGPTLTVAGEVRSFSADGRAIYTATTEGRVRKWDVATGREHLGFAGHDEPPESVALLPRGLVLSAGRNGAFRWDGEPASRGAPPPHGSEVASVEVGSGGLILSASLDGEVRRWSSDSPAEERSRSARGARFARWLGERVLVVPLEGDPSIDGRPLEGHRGVVHAASASPARLVTGAADGVLRVFALPEATLLRALPAQASAIVATALSADGRVALAAEATGTVRAWQTDSGRELARFAVEPPITSLFLSPPGDEVLVGGARDSTLVRWSSGEVRLRMPGRAASPLASPYAPSGDLVALVGPDGRLELRSPAGAFVHELVGHERLVVTTAWSPDGLLLATGSLDGTSRVWMRDGRPRTVVKRHEPVTAVALSADGAWLLGGSVSGALHRDPIHLDAALTRACEALAAFRAQAAVDPYCKGTSENARTSTRPRTPP
jgi:WD40 repeat protein/tRNA A-37 threonylcarbamoyl transferase component Bud32